MPEEYQLHAWYVTFQHGSQESLNKKKKKQQKTSQSTVLILLKDK